MFSLKEFGTITIDVLKDEANQYLFAFNQSNDKLSCIVDVLENTLKKY